MSALSRRRRREVARLAALTLVGDALIAIGSCTLCGREVGPEALGSVALEARSPASRLALDVPPGERVTVVVAACPECFAPAVRNPSAALAALGALQARGDTPN